VGTVTGRSSTIAICSGAVTNTWKSHSLYGISDFSLTLARGTVEQELVGETGNYHAPGSLSIDGSYSNCKFAASANREDINSIINATNITISGSTGASLSWCFASCMITGYDVAIGDADTISEASVDFIVMDPYNVYWTAATGRIANLTNA